MKKKTRFRLRNNLAPQFWIAIILCFAGALYSSSQFYNSFFRALEKMNEEPIATITFKYKTAQRKFMDRVVWDRLRQNSPVYNGDTIHTAALSEATIWFTDGNVMELSENSMAQVYLNEDKTLIAELESGEAVIDSSESTSGLTLSSSGVKVEVQAGSSISAASTAAAPSDSEEGAAPANTVSLQLLKGTASVTSEGEQTQTISEGDSVELAGTTVRMPSITVTSPKQNEKILYHEPGEKRVRFSWKTDFDDPENTNIILEIAQDKKFLEIIKRVSVKGLEEISIPLSSKTYYWRIRTELVQEDGTKLDGEKAAGRIQVIQSLPPDLVTPVNDYSYSYRTKLPAVRLIWSESPYASTYQLEISDSEDFSNILINQRSSSTSSIISTLNEGSYYWRVTPFYTINRKGLAEPSEIHSFMIEKKGELVSPSLVFPVDRGNVNTEASAKDIYFSWKQDPEAVSYNIKIADNPEFSNALVNVETASNNYRLEKKSSLKDGKWYWCVAQKDSEGNLSAYSEPNVFFALKGEIEQHTIEPTYGYNLATNLVPDTKFTWKRNLPENFRSIMQISTDENFSSILYQSDANGTYVKGITLSQGTYWWRLVASADDTEIVTPPKLLNVLDAMPAAVPVVPVERAVAREENPFTFSWNPVDGADFYKLSIYRRSDDTLVYADTVWDTSTEIDMYHMKEFAAKETYYYQIQAQANEVVGITSRRMSKIAEAEFRLYKLHPIVISNPAEGLEFDNITEEENPSFTSWSADDILKEAQVIVTRTDSETPVEVIKVPSDEEIAEGRVVAPSRVKLQTQTGFEPGNYEIKVNGITIDDVDISTVKNKEIRHFTVIPLLETVEAVSPVDRAVAVEEKPYVFSWKPAAGADYYKFAVYRSRDNRRVYSENVRGTSIEIDMFRKEEFAAREKYYYQIQAIADAKPGVSGRRSRISETEFTLYKLHPIRITKPNDGLQVDGVTAILNPGYVWWESDDELKEAQVIVTRTDLNPPEEVIRVPSEKDIQKGKTVAPFKVKLDNEKGLEPGTYEIKVTGITVDDVDVSVYKQKEMRHFTVNPIRPLEACSELVTEPDYFDVNYLKNRQNPRIVTMKWNKVLNATEYVYVLKDSEGNVKTSFVTAENSYEINFLEMNEDNELIYPNGTYYWTVEPKRRIDKDKDGIFERVLQTGPVSGGEFTIDIPVPTKSVAKGAMNPYGK